MEDRVSIVKDIVRADKDLHALKAQVRALQEKAVDTEGRLRRNNVQIIGLPERVEGTKPTAFSEPLLISALELGYVTHICGGTSP